MSLMAAWPSAASGGSIRRPCADQARSMSSARRRGSRSLHADRYASTVAVMSVVCVMARRLVQVRPAIHYLRGRQTVHVPAKKADRLSEYRGKRDSQRTPEPGGGGDGDDGAGAAGGDGNRFVV